MRLNTKLAALAVTAGLGIAAFASPQQADAGIIVSATANGSAIAGLNGASAQPGVDPATQNPRQIELLLNLGAVNVGGTTLVFSAFNATQNYTPLIGGSPNDITQALGDSTAISITNAGNVAATLQITVVYDSFNYPIGNPLSWASTIASSRLDGGAIFDATETVGGVTINHNALTGPGQDTIVTQISPGRPFTVTQVLDIFLPAGAIANIQKSDTLSAVPEPTTLALLGAGLLGLAAARRHRRRDHA
jgi:hypothetical protein